MHQVADRFPAFELVMTPYNFHNRKFEQAFAGYTGSASFIAMKTQVWLEFAVECKYVDRDAAAEVYRDYDSIIAMLVTMINKPENWSLKKT